MSTRRRCAHRRDNDRNDGGVVRRTWDREGIMIEM